MHDPAVLETLFLALETGAVPLPAAGPVLFLKAEPQPRLPLLPKDRLVCRASFKPDHDALAMAGYTVLNPEDPGLPAAGLTLILPPRQRDEMRAIFARALMAAPEGGVVLAALPNTLGARTAERALAELAGETASLSKHKCRAFWARKEAARFNQVAAEEWIAMDAPRQIEPGLWSRPGLFSWDRVDPGSMLLADSIPEDIKGRGADFGGGYGFLSRETLAHCPRVEHITLLEAEHRALACAEATLSPYPGRHSIQWADLIRDDLPGPFDFILMNPPFHTGRADQAALGQGFIRAAARALTPSGTLWMVANRHLPYEAVLSAAFKEHAQIEDEGGYKIIRASRPKRERR